MGMSTFSSPSSSRGTGSCAPISSRKVSWKARPTAPNVGTPWKTLNTFSFRFFRLSFSLLSSIFSSSLIHCPPEPWAIGPKGPRRTTESSVISRIIRPDRRRRCVVTQGATAHTTPHEVIRTTSVPAELDIMPFSIIRTHGPKGFSELTLVPDGWIQSTSAGKSYVYWPKGDIAKLIKVETSTPSSGWTRQACVVQKSNILSLQQGIAILSDMSGESSDDSCIIQSVKTMYRQRFGQRALENANKVNSLSECCIQLETGTLATGCSQFKTDTLAKGGSQLERDILTYGCAQFDSNTSPKGCSQLETDFFFFFGSTTDVGQGLPVPTSGLGFQ
ncbi:uncharacterized protein LOC120903787 [Anopheles arabiensis]|uniref:uncharacterized protein LOC120903787 n=1 Tax=Anopheles arabiensis TaxID=7173 RepID=UPI001AAD6601|nr:uncharacterized protein LOC120903787 [Anopheles arabiensis]